MDLQDSFSQNWQTQTEIEALGLSFQKRIRFHKLSESYKLREMSTIYEKTFMLMTQMRLIYNNGSPVPIKISHHNLANQYFNESAHYPSNIIHFSIEDDSLLIKTKLNGVKSTEMADKWIQRWSQQALLRKNHIISFLTVIGYPIDEESSFMRKILLEKKKIKNKILQILNIPKQQAIKTEDQMEIEDYETAVLYYGIDKLFNIEKCEKNMIFSQQNGVKKHKIQGGYFSIDCQAFKITNNETNEVIVQTLAMKTLREKRRNELIKENFKKMNKQLQIVKSIKDKTYLINYYCEAIENPSFVLMDKYDHSLQEYIYYNGDSLQFSQKMNVAKQIVAAVSSLHKYKVVHRDIKPSNFLINDAFSQSNPIQLKIIDFAQSYSHNLPFFEGDYGCSHPYSPLECSLKKSWVNNTPQQGLGNFQIDYWSVGVTIYELFFQKHPVSYSRPFYIDICTTWKTEFLNAVDQRSKIGFQLIDDIITILLVKSMKFEQKDRLNLDQMMHVLLELEQYMSNLVKILFASR